MEMALILRKTGEYGSAIVTSKLLSEMLGKQSDKSEFEIPPVKLSWASTGKLVIAKTLN
jgi:hypothetical protein